jgi:hypothetical protein
LQPILLQFRALLQWLRLARTRTHLPPAPGAVTFDEGVKVANK